MLQIRVEQHAVLVWYTRLYYDALVYIMMHSESHVNQSLQAMTFRHASQSNNNSPNVSAQFVQDLAIKRTKRASFSILNILLALKVFRINYPKSANVMFRYTDGSFPCVNRVFTLCITKSTHAKARPTYFGN